MSTECLLKAYQVAQILNITEDKVNKMRRDGEIPYVSFGKRSNRYKAEDVQELIERRKNK